MHDLRESFESHEKTNLQAFIFEGHDHDLNFLRWALQEEIPPGIAKIFEVSEALDG